MKNNTTNFQIFFIHVITVFLFLIVSCTPYYIASNFNSRTIKHTKVAVLPFEILFIGRMPAKLTEEIINHIIRRSAKKFPYRMAP